MYKRDEHIMEWQSSLVSEWYMSFYSQLLNVILQRDNGKKHARM